jgi:hypothetical protein
MKTYKNVPNNRVGATVQILADAGKTKIECKKEGDNNWTVTGS